MHAAIIIMTTTHVGLNRCTFSAREVLHTYLERAAKRNKNRSFPLFQQPLSFSLPFIGSKGYRDSYRGRCPPLTEQSRQSARRITKARLVDERLSPANAIHDHYLSQRTFSHSQLDPYGFLTDKIYVKKKETRKNPTSLLNELTRADICEATYLSSGCARQNVHALPELSLRYLFFNDTPNL
ncbi:hypothetical protein ALC56_02631 [Trachymyrmex septentrionalis]|uniref:Uncharacterized protein n=1 Tax=Trachymyrmex septentrionalis TaxID=34720 RepID=A0A195FSF1_9HYME|nr:hypothetical protein ALC56_02631 [Trachymyrmex septentrionalis]